MKKVDNLLEKAIILGALVEFNEIVDIYKQGLEPSFTKKLEKHIDTLYRDFKEITKDENTI